MSLDTTIEAISQTPIPIILIIAGLIFLLLAVGGSLGAKLTGPVNTKYASLIGVVLLAGGLALSFNSSDGTKITEPVTKPPVVVTEPITEPVTKPPVVVTEPITEPVTKPPVVVPPLNRKLAIKTWNNHYVVAVSGGGRVENAIHTDATKIDAWETFVLEGRDPENVAIRTIKGNYLTAVGGGNRQKDVVHTNATKIGPFETFKLIPIGSGYFAIQTQSGRYLVAVSGGGRTTDVFHSGAKKVAEWEKFRFEIID